MSWKKINQRDCNLPRMLHSPTITQCSVLHAFSPKMGGCLGSGTAAARWLEPRKGEGEKGLRNEVTHSQGPGHIELGATDQIWGFTVGTVEIHHSSLTVVWSDMAVKRSLWLPCGKIQGGGQGQEKGELKGKMMVVWTRAVTVEVVSEIWFVWI